MGSLARYIVVRTLTVVPMLLILLSVVFVVLRIIPGDPVSAILGEKAPEEYKQKLRHELGLDKPIYIQFIEYLLNIIRGDFGKSLYTKRDVISEIKERFFATLELSIFAMLVCLPISTILGVRAAHKRHRPTDHAIRLYAIITWALFIPFFGSILQLIFCVWLKLLPPGGRIDPLKKPETITGLYILDSILTGNMSALIDALQHIILPAITLGIVLSGGFIRIIRENMIITLRQDFITAARARGVKEKDVIWRHAFKNTLIPFITMFGLMFALLLAGAVLTETTFSWPGLGRYLVERIYYRDYPAVQGAIVFYAVVVALVNLLVDIAYAAIDPRIRY